MTYHLKLKFRGAADKIEFYCALMRSLDIEFPYPAKAGLHPCPKCKGYTWPNPMFGPKHLQALAGQVGLRDLKIKKFWGERACAEAKPEDLVVVATPQGGTSPIIDAVHAASSLEDLEAEVAAVRDAYGEAWGAMS